MNKIPWALIGMLLLSACSKSMQKDPKSMSWEKIMEQAKGTQMTFYMWGGSIEINSWVDNVVAKGLKDEYDIQLQRVPAGPEIYINKLLAEKQAGKQTGVIDLVWINGENFSNSMKKGLLWGPFTDKLPNFNAYVDAETVSTDFGYPTQGYEAPFGKAWYVFGYDTARMPNPPSDFAALTEWIKQNPGRFTYPQPPDFIGSAFIRLAFYALNGGPQKYLGEFDQDLARAGAANFIDWLEQTSDFLWQNGEIFPSNSGMLDALFERGEIDVVMNYNVSHIPNKIVAGQFPPTVQTFVLKDLALFNHHFTAIPFNAPNKAAAMVVANYLLSPEIQLSKASPMNWGDLSVLNPKKLKADDLSRFQAIELGLGSIPVDVLIENSVPEITPDYVEYLESLWSDFYRKLD